MAARASKSKKLDELSSAIEELDQKVLEAIKKAEDDGLMQAVRILGTIKSYVDLLRRELEVKNEL